MSTLVLHEDCQSYLNVWRLGDMCETCWRKYLAWRVLCG